MFYSICYFISVGSKLRVLHCCVAVECEMEACTEHWSVHFKQRAVIEFLTTEGVSPIEIHCWMHVVYGDHCVDVSTVLCWANRCMAGE
jgi:hypothetical protein